MPPVSAANKSQYHTLWLALPFAAYVLLPAHHYSAAGLAAALDVEKRLPFASVDFYTAVHTWIFRALYSANVHVRALYIMQFLNSVLAGLCAPLMYRELRRRTHDAGTAVGGALLFAFAAAWWSSATDAGPVVPSVFFLLAALDRLETKRSVIPAGLCTAAAVLFQPVAVFFLAFAMARLKGTHRTRGYVAVSLLPVIAVYAFAYRHWPAGKLASHHLAVFSGTLHLFFDGSLDAARRLPLATVIVLVLFVAAMLWRFRQTGATRISAPKRDLLIWLAVYIVALLFVGPATASPLFYLAPAVLLIATILPRAVLLCAALFLWNGLFLIYPASLQDNNAALRFALQQQPRWPLGTTVAWRDDDAGLATIRYFNPQAIWVNLQAADASALDKALGQAQRGLQMFWLDAGAFDVISADPAGKTWLAAHPIGLVMRFQNSGKEYRFYEVR